MMPRFEDRISEAYGEHADKYASVLEPALAPMADEIAKLARLTRRQSALDLATGTGLIARALARSTPSVVGRPTRWSARPSAASRCRSGDG